MATASGHRVKSFSEARIDDWFHDQGLQTIYEPSLVLEDTLFVPDWLILPDDHTVLRPILVEYWGLLRDGQVADWVVRRRDRYVSRKLTKERVYGASGSYDFIGIMPEQLADMDAFTAYMHEQMGILRRRAHLRRFTGWNPDGDQLEV